jgi:hypothetical protein
MKAFLSLENFLYKQLYKFFFYFFLFTLLLFSLFFCGFIDLFFVNFEGFFSENSLIFHKNFVYEVSDTLINSNSHDYSLHNLLFFFSLSMNRLVDLFFSPFFYFIDYSGKLSSGFIYFLLIFYFSFFFLIFRVLFKIFLDY